MHAQRNERPDLTRKPARRTMDGARKATSAPACTSTAPEVVTPFWDASVQMPSKNPWDETEIGPGLHCDTDAPTVTFSKHTIGEPVHPPAGVHQGETVLPPIKPP